MKRFAVPFGFAAVTLQEWTVSVLQTGGREEKCVHHIYQHLCGGLSETKKRKKEKKKKNHEREWNINRNKKRTGRCTCI